jgi:hypothetical protein
VRDLAAWLELPEQRQLYDGMVFTPVRRGYHLGRCDQLLNWKPPQLVTADLWWNGPGDARVFARSDAADSVAIQVGLVEVGFCLEIVCEQTISSLTHRLRSARICRRGRASTSVGWCLVGRGRSSRPAPTKRNQTRCPSWRCVAAMYRAAGLSPA